MTKKETCLTNSASAYYPLDSYGYNVLYFHGFDFSDNIYISYEHYHHEWVNDKYVSTQIVTYHRLKTYWNEIGTYFLWNGKRVYFKDFYRLEWQA